MIYTIKKGKHYSTHLPSLHFGIKKMKVSFSFGVSCWYRMIDPDDYAINKLCGFSLGFHHRDSIRCGWHPSEKLGMIDLFFYLYNGGKRIEHQFTTVSTFKGYELTILMGRSSVSFELHGSGQSAFGSTAFVPPRFLPGYQLFPYIGGKKPARVDTFIILDSL